MKVSYNWLKEFVDTDQTPDQLSSMLTMLGLEVEGTERTGEGLDDVVVAVVEERAQHPNADKLSCCRVNNGREVLNIVCGAQNFKAGDKVALAQIGAVLPGDFRIKKSKIRGEESFGMLCSEKELGLADESAGIMILPADLPLGIPVFSALGLKDVIFEIGLTPNRADCLSVIGIAREVAAKLGKKVDYAPPRVVEGALEISTVASVTIDDPDLCPRYTARYISGCTIGPSPQWLVSRLNAVGMRSINNVVDVTNYVLMEYGHPLHAFDFDRLAGGRIVVRRAGAEECFTSLDGQERQLTITDLTIRDGERAVALAGIMGGENSEIADTTANILLESAYFSPTAIRLTSKRLGLHTESSHRFERGADVNIVTTALDRAAALIAELAGGEVARGVIDVYPQPVPERIVPVRCERVNSILGLQLSTDEIADLLRRLEFSVTVQADGRLAVTVPSFRVDIEREIDLVEEVARLHGYEQIPVTMPLGRVHSERLPLNQWLERELKNIMVGQGFNEVINFSFASPVDSEKLQLVPQDRRRSAVKLLNPLIDEHSVMRTTLLPGLLQTAAKNFNVRTVNLRLFEMRRVYLPTAVQELPHEPLHLAGVLAGARATEGWNQPKEQVDFYDVKGVVETIAVALRLPAVTYQAEPVESFYHPGKACSVLVNDEVIGSLGEIHPDVQENFALERPIYYFELDFERLLRHSQLSVAIVPPARFPDILRDIALLVPDNVAAATILSTIRGQKTDRLADVTVFDLYQGSNLPEGHRSIAVRLRYSAPDRTLTDDEVNRLHQKIVDNLTARLPVSIR